LYDLREDMVNLIEVKDEVELTDVLKRPVK
jgi:hypothetical protein